ncbi:hypothetical protein E2C01_009218 [Portunus trituberculatus]|uniref:Uncharacterized protein n=1 Tax=Portunus trituberculatus TaxID=210409 RepID=A0A5B7D4T3_PORTR|nr:hypothetical protein [Portunus trituberculatus]
MKRHSIRQEFQLPKRRLHSTKNRTQKNNNKQPTDCSFLKWRAVHSLFGRLVCLLRPTFWNSGAVMVYRIHSFTWECHGGAFKTVLGEKLELVPTVFPRRAAV